VDAGPRGDAGEAHVADAVAQLPFGSGAEDSVLALQLLLGEGEPPVGEDFRRLATIRTFGDSWPCSGAG
jgi:hypothetical protein